MADRFATAMRLMRKHHPQLQEDGFEMLRPVAAVHLSELIGAYESETDPGLRRWLLELIASTGRVEGLPVLAEALYSDDASLRDWAAVGLVRIDTKEARTVLFQHRGNARS